MAILDGGIPNYLKSGGPTESGGPQTPQPATYKADFIKADQTRSYEQMLFNFKENLEQVCYVGTVLQFHICVSTNRLSMRCSFLGS